MIKKREIHLKLCKKHKINDILYIFINICTKLNLIKFIIIQGVNIMIAEYLLEPAFKFKRYITKNSSKQIERKASVSEILNSKNLNLKVVGRGLVIDLNSGVELTDKELKENNKTKELIEEN